MLVCLEQTTLRAFTTFYLAPTFPVKMGRVAFFLEAGGLGKLAPLRYQENPAIIVTIQE